VVQAMPGDTLPFAFSAAVPALAVVRFDSTAASPSFTVASMAERDTTVLVTAAQLGVVTAWQATVERGDPYQRTFAAPEWASKAVVEVQVTPEFWNTVTDFGITLFDRDGAQLGQGPMNYDFNRVTVDLPAKRGPDFPVTVELFPAFAHPVAPASFAATVRLAFVGPPRALPPAGGQLAPVTIPARGSQRVEIPAFTSLVTAPEWSDLVRIRVAASADDWIAIEREIGVSKR
jgi:hypothetical protein